MAWRRARPRVSTHGAYIPSHIHSSHSDDSPTVRPPFSSRARRIRAPRSILVITPPRGAHTHFPTFSHPPPRSLVCCPFTQVPPRPTWDPVPFQTGVRLMKTTPTSRALRRWNRSFLYPRGEGNRAARLADTTPPPPVAVA